MEGLGKAPFSETRVFLGIIAKASPDSCLPLPQTVVNWGGDIYSYEGQMLLLLLGFPFGKNVSLIYSIVLPGKAVTCVYMHVHVVCMWKSGQVKSIDELPPVSPVCQSYPPLFFILQLGIDIGNQPASDFLCLFLTCSSPVSVFQPPVMFLLGASFSLPICCREGVRMLSSHEQYSVTNQLHFSWAMPPPTLQIPSR